jgi:hypothetical protein
MENKIFKKFQIKGLVNESFIKKENEMKNETLLLKYKSEINSYLKKQKSNILHYIEDDNNIDLLDIEFRKYIESDVDKFDDFIKYLIKTKFQIVQQRKLCNDFMKHIQDIKNILKFPSLLKEDTYQKYIISNIFSNDDFGFNVQSNQIRIMNKMIKSEFFENKKKQDSIGYAFANTSYYHNINLYSPSIGNIYLLNLLQSSITHMILGLCNGESDILSLIPLHNQNIKDDITSFVINKESSNSDYKKKVLSSVLNNIDLNYDQIFKDKNKIKKVFIIPYQKDEITDESGEVKHKFTYTKYITASSSKDVMKANNELLSKTWDLIKENPKNLNLPFVKDILALYVYFAIQLFYETYYQYFSKISNILYEFNEDSRFSEDNVDLGILYIDKCIESLKTFKKILLNNFYDFFLPSRVTKAYGIKVDENGFVVCGSKLAIDNEFLIKKYPFQHFDNSGSKLNIDKESLLKVNHFIIGKKRNGDLYNPKENLYIGFYLPNESKMKDLVNFYKYYIQVLLTQFSFSIYICNLLSKRLLTNIPIEIVEQIYKKIDELKEDSSTKSKNEIVLLCYKHLYKSYNLIKTSKDKKFNKEKVKDLKEEEEYILLSNFYYNYATILFEYVNRNQKLDIKTKNYLIQMMKRGFKKIESKL